MATITRQLSLDEAFDTIGAGKFQRKLMWVAGASWAADAMEVLLISFAIPSLMESWGLSRPQAGLLGTALFIGMMMGAWGWGSLVDRVGRRPGFILTILVDSMAGLLSALAPSYGLLFVFRLLTGVGVGGTLPVDYALTSEFLPRKIRGRWLVYLESFWAAGTVLAAALGWLVIPRLPDIGWRVLFAASAVPGLIVFWIRREIPESPRYLLVNGQGEEAASVLRQVAAENGVDLGEFELRLDRVSTGQSSVPLWDILRKPLIKHTLITSGVWFLLSLGYYGIFIWLPGILIQRGFDFVRTYQYTLLMALAQVPGYLSAAYLIEKWGRRRTLAAYLVASGVFTYLFAVTTGVAGVLGSAILMSFFTLGAWGSLYAWTPELYPTTARATGMGWASAMARVAGILAPTLGAMLLGLSLPLALTLYAIAFVLAGALSLAGRETMGIALPDSISA